MTNRVWKFALALVMTGGMLTQSAFAQQPPNTADLKADIEALKAGLAAIQQDLQQIKSMLQGVQPAAAAQTILLDLGSHPSRGEKTAQLTIVEFSDYECPFCGRHVKETWPQLQKDYIDTGKAKIVFVDFPLESIHKNALKAAEAARCAGEQGKYWQMHDRLYASQDTLSAWATHAAAVGVDVARFESCMASGKFADEIRKDIVMGRSAGVSGTPSFFFAVTDPASTKVKTIGALKGAQPYASFQQQIDALLRTSK